MVRHHPVPTMTTRLRQPTSAAAPSLWMGREYPSGLFKG